ncbi:hypothetical protein [Bosea sp. BIWAKO-01]|uniref:hypothetical protein n=1 Tax=Bosea sp. BIWAKO-01 TaxID=506668 RepID=UPI00086EB3EB|nr:hypothetical protein [Bosea sp. BIWAKO-01]GAU82425.1 hypothetical protein BIWAKO_02343 [Bosea sp. BIWAKO-01]
MSHEFAALLVNGFRRLGSSCRDLGSAAAHRALPVAGSVKGKFGGPDPIGALISVMDHVETAMRTILRWLRAAVRHRGLGLTGGLAWRGLAAVTGIGMAAALVTGLSGDGGEMQIASLAEQPAAEIRPVRDVRQEPRLLGARHEDWTRIARPTAMFGLDSPELERQSPVYEASRSQDGTKREDVLSFGAFAEAKPHLLLRLVVDHGDDHLTQPFIIALVREAAARGMSVQRSGAPTGLSTKFGSVEATDVTLSDGATERACIGFRHRGGDTPLRLSGWWCGGAARPADRQQLACLVDGLALLGSGEDHALRGAFVAAERNRDGACSLPRPSATGRKTSSSDADGTATGLRTAAKR